ncbi:MAG: DUF1150 family protein [Alphaproteobacteria bacterium]|nr:DUF1150 family protein [Alphaproteobacteria bacterium]
MTTIQERLKLLSAQDFAVLGLNDVAYVKRVVVDQQVGYSIHAADGKAIGMAPNRESAFAGIRQHELEPVSAH